MKKEMTLDHLELGLDYRYSSGIEDMIVPYVGAQPVKAKENHNMSKLLKGESRTRWIREFGDC